MGRLNELLDQAIAATDWGSYALSGSSGAGVPVDLQRLIASVADAEAEDAYWRLDNRVIVQGRYFDVVVPMLAIIGLALQLAELSEAARYRLVELITEIALGTPHEDVTDAMGLGSRVSHSLDALTGILLAQLSSPDSRVRLDVVEILATREAYREFRALTRQLLVTDPDEKVRNRASRLS